MKLEFSNLREGDHICFADELGRLKKYLSELEPVSGNFGKSKTIRKKMDKLKSENSGWLTKIKVTPEVAASKGNQNYVVEYVKDFSCNLCHQSHRLLVELAFDNRQAIPANIFKLDIGCKNFEEKRGSKALGVLVCLKTDAREAGLWDKAVGTFDEYDTAISLGYAKYLHESILLLAIAV